MLLKYVPMTGIVDFCVINAEGEKTQILALRETNGKLAIQVLALPSLKIQHTIDVASPCWLARNAASLVSIFFVEGRPSEKTDGVCDLYLRAISETVPIQRFQELMQKRKYREAEAFAKQYGLDEEVQE